MLSNYIMSGQNKKKPGTYSLIKGSKKALSPFCDLYQAYNHQTQLLWYGKVFNNEIINQDEDFREALEFNIQVMHNSKQLQYVLYVEQIFQLGNTTFFIHEMYDQTLQQKVQSSEGNLESWEIEQIIKEILSGLYQLYQQGYATRSLRPQHIVSVDDVWKIQSFVLNARPCPKKQWKSELFWDRNFASPEDRKQNGQLEAAKTDEQIVWNLGILGLYMFLGKEFDYSKINSDKQIPWGKLKQKNISEQLESFLRKALVIEFKDRLKIKDLMNYKLFEGVSVGSSPFLSYSKFYKAHNSKIVQKKQAFASRIVQKKQKVQALSQEEEKKLLQMKNSKQKSVYFSEVQKYSQQLPFKSNFDNHIIKYICFKISLCNLEQLKNQILEWKRQNSDISYCLAVKEFEEEITNLYKKNKQSCSIYAKMVQGKKYGPADMCSQFLKKQINDETIKYEDVASLYCKVAGKIYTLLSRENKKNQSQEKDRTICYYSLGAYLIYFLEIRKFKKEFIDKNVLKLSKYIKEEKIYDLIRDTQNLLKEYFALAEA